jgi:DNA-binding NarL/FixJ family response regulator
MTCVLLVDQHELVRRGVRRLLEAESGFEVCGEAADGREAVEKAMALQPDVVVLDAALPGLNGIEAAQTISRALTHTAIVFLTADDSEPVVRGALQAGAIGYVLKSDAARLLVAAVKHAHTHEPFLTSKVAQIVLAGFLGRETGAQAGDADQPASSLTRREREVLQLIAEGNSNKEVASALGIGVKTVEAHRASIMSRLSFHSVADLVRYAVRNSIIGA